MRCPSPRFHTGNGNHQRCARRDEDGQVDDPVLHRTEQLVAVHEKDRCLTRVHDAQLWHLTMLRDLGDLYRPGCASIREGEVAGCARRRLEQGDDREIAETSRRACDEPDHAFTYGAHEAPPGMIGW